jgi:folylpolyglutamate synthase/dihydropteroate synthase
MLTALLPICGALVATTAPSPRAMPAAQIAAIASEVALRPRALDVIDDPPEALARACQHSSHVVAAGSMFLIGPLRGILR